MSDTPETDAAIKAAGGDWSPVLCAVSQRLERERNGARELAAAFHRDQVTLLLERDEAREALRAFKHDKKHLCDSHRDMRGNCIVCQMEETK